MKVRAPILVPTRKLAGGLACVGVEIEIRDVPSGDAPVAATLPTYGATRSWRVFDGRLWQPKETASGIPVEAPEEPFGLDTYAAMREGKHPLALHDLRLDDLWKQHDYSASEADPEEIEACEQLAALRRRAERTIVVDGVFHGLSAGPTLQLVDQSNPIELKWSAGWRQRARPNQKCATFAWNELEQALDVARRLKLKPTKFEHEPQIDLDLMPGRPFDSLALATEGTAWTLAGHLRQYAAKNVLGEALEPYARLRELLTRRWPDRALNFDAQPSTIWPHAQDESDFPDAADLYEPILTLIEKAGPRSAPLKTMLSVAGLRIGDALAARPTPEEDEAALELGPRP